MTHPIVEAMTEDIAEAFKMFGEYPYFDKGPSEVMDVEKWVERLRSLPVSEAGEILIELADTDDAGELLASDILMEMQDWDELFENEEVAELL